MSECLPGWRPHNVVRRVNRARKFGKNTCPCSRHTELIARELLLGNTSLATFEPEYTAVSLLVTVELLYKARTEIARLRAKLAEGQGQ